MKVLSFALQNPKKQGVKRGRTPKQMQSREPTEYPQTLSIGPAGMPGAPKGWQPGFRFPVLRCGVIGSLGFGSNHLPVVCPVSRDALKGLSSS